MSHYVTAVAKAITLLLDYVTKESVFGKLVLEAEKALAELLDVLESHHQAEARMRLIELQHLLKRCHQTIGTCREQIDMCAKISSSRVGRRVKTQLGEDSDQLDPKLAEMFLGNVTHSLKEICATTERFETLGTMEGLTQAKCQIQSLSNEKTYAEKVASAASVAKKAAVFGLVVTGGVAAIVFFFPSAAAVTWVFQLVTTQTAATTALFSLLGLGATAVVAGAIRAKADVVVSTLQKLTDKFLDVYEQLQTVNTTIHGIKEMMVPTQGQLDLARRGSAQATNESEKLALMDSVEELLNNLEKLKGENKEDK